jgi:hypothetical protein
MNKRITDVAVQVDRWGFVNVTTWRRWPDTAGSYCRSYNGGYWNTDGCVDRAFRRLVRIQALQLALFKKNQEQQ